MTADEFLRLAASQEPIVIEHDVSVPGPGALALLDGRRSVPLTEFLEHPDGHWERRSFRYGHLVEAGTTSTDLSSWQQQFPRFPLPDDLRSFLLRANGIQLWADLDARHAYFRLLPLARWYDAASAPSAYVFETPPAAALVLSDADDAAGYAVLDTRVPEYLWCDPIAGPESIGNAVDDLLAYWWRWCALDPRGRPTERPTRGRRFH